jgi:hypothetical protein
VLRGGACLAISLALACQASVQADARASTRASDDEIKSYDRPMEGPVTAPAPPEDDLLTGDYACPPKGTLGASYQGYGTDGNDVVVYVEALGEGRPMTSGAIIPRPKASGSVFVEPTNAVYGKPLTGKSKRCKLDPPGSGKP